MSAPEGNDTRIDRFSRISIHAIRAMIAAAAFMVPLLSLPFTRDALFVKVVFVEAVALLVGALWLLDVLLSKRIVYRRSPLNMLMVVAAGVLLASTVASSAPWSSFWGVDPTGEKAASLLSFFIISLAAAAVFRKSDAAHAAVLLIAGQFLLGLFALTSLFAPRLGVALPPWLAANPLGTVNAFALVLGGGFLMAVIFSFAAVTSRGRRLVATPLLAFVVLTAMLSGTALIFIGFGAVWIGVAVVTALFLATNFSKLWPPGPAPSLPALSRSNLSKSSRAPSPEHAFGPVAATVAFLILLSALFFALWPGRFTSSIFAPPVEVSPSLVATLAIDRKALGQDPVLGLGPSNFQAAFNQFRDASFNQTIFWQTRFSHGFSFLATLPATLGLAGAIAFLLLAVLGIGIVWRAIFRSEGPNPYVWAFGALAVFVLIEWFLYASNFTATFLALLSLGLVTTGMQEPRQESSRMSWWRVARRTVELEGAALHFTSSLVAVFAAAFSLLGLWALGSAYAAEAYAGRALRLGQAGDAAGAVAVLDRALRLNPNEALFYQLQAEARLESVSRVIAEAAASPNADLSGQFRTGFGNGVSAANAAIRLEPADPRHWVTLGQLYETVIPFIPGADAAADNAYARAARFDPLDPLVRLVRGRSALVAADTVSLQASRSAGEERERLDILYREFLGRCRGELEAAINLKPDLAAAHFLLAQVHLREGNLSQAIRNVEATAAIAPGDIGVAFQLGFLYYRNEDFARAEREFRRALLLDTNYSNARYFLGLIYDRRGDRSAALAEFKKIAALNPDNGEVKKIVLNLSSNRRALDGILPPPEARRDVPIRENAPRR